MGIVVDDNIELRNNPAERIGEVTNEGFEVLPVAFLVTNNHSQTVSAQKYLSKVPPSTAANKALATIAFSISLLNLNTLNS